MKHGSCCCHCGHSGEQHDESGKCEYEYWDDGQYYEGHCGCEEFYCNYAGKQYSGTVCGGCLSCPRCGLRGVSCVCAPEEI